MRNAISESFAESTRECHGRIDKCQSNGAFVGSIPKCDVVGQPGRESGLEHAEKETCGSETGKVLDTPHAHADGTLVDHQKSKPLGRSELLEQIVGWYFENAVNHEEYHQCHRILRSCSMGDRKEVLVPFRVHHLCIPDIAPVQVSQKVHHGAKRNQAHILLPQKFRIRRGIGQLIARVNCRL